jgi:hypothetical protein
MIGRYGDGRACIFSPKRPKAGRKGVQYISRVDLRQTGLLCSMSPHHGRTSMSTLKTWRSPSSTSKYCVTTSRTDKESFHCTWDQQQTGVRRTKIKQLLRSLDIVLSRHRSDLHSLVRTLYASYYEHPRTRSSHSS